MTILRTVLRIAKQKVEDWHNDRLFAAWRAYVTLLLFSVLLLLAGAGTARGQSALDGFDPNPNGIVSVAVVQPDGKILIGGTFTTLSPNGGGAVARNHLARLNADGTALVYSTYLGGSDHAIGLGIAADTAGNAYVTGAT